LKNNFLIQFLELKIDFAVEIQHGKKNYTFKMWIILKCDFKIYYTFKTQWSEGSISESLKMILFLGQKELQETL
jgi:hypothetical protein